MSKSLGAKGRLKHMNAKIDSYVDTDHISVISFVVMSFFFCCLATWVLV